MIICYHVAALAVEELAVEELAVAAVVAMAAITGGCDYYLL